MKLEWWPYCCMVGCKSERWTLAEVSSAAGTGAETAAPEHVMLLGKVHGECGMRAGHRTIDGPGYARRSCFQEL